MTPSYAEMSPYERRGRKEKPHLSKPIGNVLGGYRLLRLVGSGGMGVVFSCEDLGGRNPRPLVLKRFRPDRVNPRLVSAIATRLQRLQHRNLARVVDSDRAGSFLVMERLYGRSLGAVLKSFGLLSHGEFRKLATALSGALGILHEAGLAHLDVRPSNILRTAQGWVLIDLCIPYAVPRRDSVEVDLARRGAATYCAPEVLQGRATGPRSDIYSLSMTLFHAIVGRRPDRSPDGNLLGRYGYDVAIGTELLRVFREGARASPTERPTSVNDFVRAVLTASAAR